MNVRIEDKLKSTLKSLRMNESVISTILGALVVVVVGVLVYNYFSSVNNTAISDQVAVNGVSLVEENGELVPQDLPITHTVAKGEHLWSIAEKYYESGYNWVNIAKENKLSNANVVTEGQELVIPRVGVITLEVSTPAVAGTQAEQPKGILSSNYVVVSGDTLWSIAVRAYGDGYQWTKVWEANLDQVPDPNLIEKGTELKLSR